MTLIADNPSLTATAPPVRRTQAQRSAVTRAKLMRAAIFCLRRHGYSATTTLLVAEQARVSRGAMLHQFPTKVDLMLAVVEHVFQHQKRYYARRLGGAPAGLERFVALTDVAWRGQSRTPALAMLEILVAARSDQALAERLTPLAEAIDRDMVDGVCELAEQAGIHDREQVETLVRLHLAAMRGLSIELMYAKDPKPFEAAIALLKTYKRFLIDRLLAQG